MSSKKLVTPVTAFKTQDGEFYSEYDDAALAAASSAIEEVSRSDADGTFASAAHKMIYMNSWTIAEFIRDNRPLIRKILGL